MPINHTRKTRLAALKTAYGVKHADAIALLDHPDAGERELLCELIVTYRDVTTYKDALDCLALHRSDPRWPVPADDDADLCPRCRFGDGRRHCCECGAGIDYDCVCGG